MFEILEREELCHKATIVYNFMVIATQQEGIKSWGNSIGKFNRNFGCRSLKNFGKFTSLLICTWLIIIIVVVAIMNNYSQQIYKSHPLAYHKSRILDDDITKSKELYLNSNNSSLNDLDISSILLNIDLNKGKLKIH